MEYWITFVFQSFNKLDDVKNEIEKLPFEISDYTEGILPQKHLSICFVGDKRMKKFLKNYCDNIAMTTKGVLYVAYGLTILEYNYLIKDDIK